MRPTSTVPPLSPKVAARPIRPAIVPKRRSPRVSTVATGTTELVTPAVIPKTITNRIRNMTPTLGMPGAHQQEQRHCHCDQGKWQHPASGESIHDDSQQ